MGLRHLFAALLCAVSLPAQADWYEASSKHFVIYSELAPDKLKAFAENLERFDAAVRVLGGHKDETPDVASRLTVFMVDDMAEVAKLAGSSSIAGFYLGRASGALAVVPRDTDWYSPDLTTGAILLHEYAHHLMSSLAPHATFPAWYSEGWAETFATTAFAKDGSVEIGKPAQYRSFGLFDRNALPVDKMLVAETIKLSQPQLQQLYGRAWLASHYLLLSGQRKGQLSQYLRALNEGKPSLEAAKAFGDLAVLNKEIEEYKWGRLGGIRIPADRVAPGPVSIRPLSPGEDATMDVRIRSKVGVTQKTAPDVYARAKKAAAPFSQDWAAQLMLAEAAYDAKDYTAAEAAADLAIAANPNAVRAYTYKAMARMAAAEKAGDRNPDTWKGIRTIIASANRIDANDPVPLVLYFESFQKAGLPPTANAKAGLERAFELCPQDDELRFNLAAMFLRDKDAKTSRALLAPLAYQPHGRGYAKRAGELIALIDQGDMTAALNKLDEKPVEEKKEKS